MDKQGITQKPHVIYSTLTKMTSVAPCHSYVARVPLKFLRGMHIPVMSPPCPGTKRDRFEIDVAHHLLPIPTPVSCLYGWVNRQATISWYGIPSTC